MLSDPNKLKKKKPFTRGAERNGRAVPWDKIAGLTDTVDAYVPNYRQRIVTQEQFMREEDPLCHDVLFDENLPSLCIKLEDGNFYTVKYSRMSVPFQRNIKNKQLLHLTGNPMQFTLMNTNPADKMSRNFTTFKQYWEQRNQDGMKNKMVEAQLALGDAGLLYYFDYKGQIKSRLISYRDGYVLCPHNDQNGDRILESIYYVKDDVEYIDSYDDTYMTRWTRGLDIESLDESGWVREPSIPHGFNEIPLITKRGKVAWDGVENIIESYEIIYNVFNAIQRRWGNGVFYVRGKFKQQAEKINGAFVLNDTSLDGKGHAEFLSPPSPENMIETLNLLFDTIQLASSTTFLLPKDLKTGGDLAGITVKLVQNQDIQIAMQKAIDWQNVVDKQTRLFLHGLAVELVNSGENPTALTDFADLNIHASLKVWIPQNEYEYNQMITILTGAGVLSKESGIELNTLAKPDEKSRITRETEESERKAMERMTTGAQPGGNDGNSESQTETQEEE